jgi:tetratricopeptide (TPR) repeat protein
MCREALELLEGAEGEADRGLRGMLHGALGWFLHCHSPAGASRHLERGLEILEARGAGPDLAFGRTVALCADLWRERDVELPKLLETLAMYEEADDRWGVGIACEILAFYLERTDPPRAMAYARRSLRLRRRQGDLWGVALSQFILGSLAEANGLPRAAKERYRESMRLRRELGVDESGVVRSLHCLGRIDRRLGDYEGALRQYESALLAARKTGNRWLTAVSLVYAGETRFDRGEIDGARRYLGEALELHEELGGTTWIDIIHALLANIAYAEGRYDEMRHFLDLVRADMSVSTAEDRDGDSRFPAPIERPADSRRFLGEGRRLMLEGDGPSALRCFAEGLRCAVRDDDQSVLAETLAEIGMAWCAAGETDRGVPLLRYVRERPETAPRVMRELERMLHRESAGISEAGSDSRDLEEVAEEIANRIEGCDRDRM